MLSNDTACSGTARERAAHVTVSLYATPAAAAFAKKSRLSASRHAKKPTQRIHRSQYLVPIPIANALSACLPACLPDSLSALPLEFFLKIQSCCPLSSYPFNQLNLPNRQGNHFPQFPCRNPRPATPKLAPRLLLLFRFPRRAIAGFLFSTTSSSNCYRVEIPTSNFYARSRRSASSLALRDRTTATMAPKQATLGYVTDGQTTLGWVIDYLPERLYISISSSSLLGFSWGK